MPDPGTDAHQKLLITLLRAAEDVQSNLGGKTLWSHGFKDQGRKDIYHKCIKGQFAAYFKRSDGAVYSLDQVKKFFDSSLDEWEQRAGTRNQTGDADEAESEMDRRLRVLCEARKAAANSNSDSALYKKSKAEYAEHMVSVQEFELQKKEARSKKQSRIHHDKRELDELIAHYHENSDDCAKSLEAANDGKAPTREEIIDCMHRDDAKARALLKNHFSTRGGRGAISSKQAAEMRRAGGVLSTSDVETIDDDDDDDKADFELKKPADSPWQSAGTERKRRRPGQRTPKNGSAEAMASAALENVANMLDSREQARAGQESQLMEALVKQMQQQAAAEQRREEAAAEQQRQEHKDKAMDRYMKMVEMGFMTTQEARIKIRELAGV